VRAPDDEIRNTFRLEANACESALFTDLTPLLQKVANYPDAASIRPYLPRRMQLPRKTSPRLTAANWAAQERLVNLLHQFETAERVAVREHGYGSRQHWIAVAEYAHAEKLWHLFQLHATARPPEGRNDTVSATSANLRVIEFFKGNWRLLDGAVAASKCAHAVRREQTELEEQHATAKRAEWQMGLGEVSRAMATVASVSRALRMTEDREEKLKNDKYKTGELLTDPTAGLLQFLVDGDDHTTLDARYLPPRDLYETHYAVDFDETTLRKVLKRIPRSSAVGVDGLSPAWVQHMMDGPTLNKLMRLLVAGRATPFHYACLAGGTATLLSKLGKPHDFRPVVPQSVLIRLAGKVLLNTYRSDVSGVLGPYQTAVNCPAGLEASTLALQEHWFTNGDDAVFLQWDYANGYGNVHRHSVREWTREELPAFYPLVRSVYGDVPTRVTYRGAESTPQALGVADGILQGDVLSAMLYTGLNVTARKRANDRGLAQCHASEDGQFLNSVTPGGVMLDYIDDNMASARNASMGQDMMLAALDEARRHGMHPKAGKMFIASFNPAVLVPALWAALTAYLLEHYGETDAETGQRHPTVEPIFVYMGDEVVVGGDMADAAEGPRAPDHRSQHPRDYRDDPSAAPTPQAPLRGITILGKPIGSRRYVDEHMSTKLGPNAGVQHSLRRLEQVPLELDTILKLLRYCVQERVTYFSRTLTRAEFSHSAEAVEGWISTFLWRLVDWTPPQDDQAAAAPGEHDATTRKYAQLTAQARRTAELSIGRGGLGIRDPRVVGSYAPLAAMADALNSDLQTIFHTERRLARPEYQCTAEEWRAAAGGDDGETMPPSMRRFYAYHHLRSTIDALDAAHGGQRGNTAPDGEYPLPRSTAEFLAEVHSAKYQPRSGGIAGGTISVQRRMGQWIQDRQLAYNVNNAFSATDRTRLISQAGFGGMAMFNMIPQYNGDKWKSTFYRDELREVLGLPSQKFYDPRIPEFYDTIQDPTPQRCSCTNPGTNEHPLLTRAHAGRCRLDGSPTRTHNKIRDNYLYGMRDHGITSLTKEPRGAGVDYGPDIETLDERFGKQRIDITVVQPDGRSSKPGHGATAAEEHKAKSADAEECRRTGFNYTGLGVETTGAFGSAAATQFGRMWQHIKVPGTFQEFKVAKGAVLPLQHELDRMPFTAPTPTAYLVQQINSTLRMSLAQQRVACINRMAYVNARERGAATTAATGPRWASRPRRRTTDTATGPGSGAQTARMNTQRGDNTAAGDGAPTSRPHTPPTPNAEAPTPGGSAPTALAPTQTLDADPSGSSTLPTSPEVDVTESATGESAAASNSAVTPPPAVLLTETSDAFSDTGAGGGAASD